MIIFVATLVEENIIMGKSSVLVLGSYPQAALEIRYVVINKPEGPRAQSIDTEDIR